MTLYPGAVVEPTFTFSQNGIPTDPGGAVTITVRDPAGTVTAYTGGQLIHVANSGVYSVQVLCPLPGTWVANVSSAAGAGEASDEVTWPIAPSQIVTPVQSPLQLATAAATTIVEEFLRHPLALITGEVTRVWVDETGSAELPLRPVVAVTAVVRSWNQMPITDYTTHLQCVQNLWGVDWVDVTYNHGWADDAVPPIIGVIIASLATRILANPEFVQRKRLGDALVDFRGGGSPALSPEDEKLLARYRSGPGTSSTFNQLLPPPPGPRIYEGDWW